MKTSRKIIGFLILLPVPFLLVALTWLGGIGNFVSTPTELRMLSHTTMRSFPPFLDRSFQLITKSHALKDKRAKEWVQALNKANMLPSTLLRNTGVLLWTKMETERLTHKLQQLLKGEITSKNLSFELGHLKRFLGSKRVDALLLQLLAQLPACNASQLMDWQRYQLATTKKGFPPACQPSKLLLPSILRSKRDAIMRMPQRIELIPQAQIKRSISFLQYARWLPWMLFSFPIFLLLIGAGLGGTGLRGFFLWSGFVTTTGGLFAISSPFFLKDVLIKSLLLEPWHHGIREHLPLLQPTFHQWLFQEALPLFRDLTAPLFSSVETVGLFVCVAGVLLFGLGLIIRPKE